MKGAPEYYASHVIKATESLVIEPLNAPCQSWWINADRDTFKHRLLEERDRMRASRFGRNAGLFEKGFGD